jgi:hypothetical protein
MKSFILTSIILALTLSITAQVLLDTYNKEKVELIADNNFGKNNDWNKIFRTYTDTTWYGKAIGKRKSLIVLKNGTVLVNNIYRNYYSKFSSNGDFIEEFGIKKANGKRLKKIEPIFGYIGNTLYTGANNMGEIMFFDINGNYKKSLKLNYSVRQIITLSDTKLAVVGWSIWKTKFRDFVVIVDYNTNKQTIIWEHFTEKNNSEMFNYSYQFDSNDKNTNGYTISISTMPFSKYTGMSLPPIINNINNQLIITIPSTGEILTYDSNGNKLKKQVISWAKNELSIEEQKEIQNRAINKYKNIKIISKDISTSENQKAINTIVEKMESDLENIKKPLSIPVFSTVIKDSDNNLLFFEISKKDNDNKFNVWVLSEDGSFKYRSSFVCKDYNLEINPKKMYYHNGYIYSLQTKKNVEGIPLRLVRFKLQ